MPPSGRVGSWRRDAAVAAAILVLLAGGAFLPFDPPRPPAPAVADGLRALPLLLLAAAALVPRRRYPVPALVACALLDCIAVALGLLTPVFIVPTAVAMYTVARWTTRRTTVVLAAVLAAVLPVVSLAASPGPADYPPAILSARAVQLAAIVAFAAALGDAARSRRATLDALTERARRAEESREAEARRRIAEDRLAIARSLHDSVAHRIAVINLHASVAERAVVERPEDARRSLEVIGGAAREVIGEIGDLLGLLRSADPASVRGSADGLEDLDALLSVFDAGGLRVSAELPADGSTVPSGIGAVANRVVQEGLTNAHKHGERAEAALRVAVLRDELRVTVVNPARPAAVRAGHGLTGMRERIAEAGGTLRATNAGGEFRLEAVLPLGGGA